MGGCGAPATPAQREALAPPAGQPRSGDGERTQRRRQLSFPSQVLGVFSGWTPGLAAKHPPPEPGARVMKPQPRRGENANYRKPAEREHGTQAQVLGTGDTLASLKEPVPLRAPAPGPPVPSGSIAPAPGQRRLGCGRARRSRGRSRIRGASRRPRRPLSLRGARGVSLPLVSGLGRSVCSSRPESSRPAGLRFLHPPPLSPGRGRQPRRCAPEARGPRPRAPVRVRTAAGPQSAAGRGGASGSVGACACVCRGAGAWGARAAADSPPRLRTVARGGGGGGGGARANSRSPGRGAAPGLIPERPVIGPRPPLCKRAEGMEFLGPGLQ